MGGLSVLFQLISLPLSGQLCHHFPLTLHIGENYATHETPPPFSFLETLPHVFGDKEEVPSRLVYSK